jgi:membrane-associated phospholipid phosphatase
MEAAEEETTEPVRSSRYAAVTELGLAAVALGLYLAVGRLTVDSTDEAVGHARDVLRLEELLGLDLEHRVQDLTSAVPGLSEVITQFYVWGYFPTLVPVVVWLFLRHRDAYRPLRNALAASGVVGLVVYAVYPCAPPWIGGTGFTDTVADGPFYDVARPGGITNHLGALPSFHVGWVILVALAVHRVARSRTLRGLAVAWPLLMSYAVVATGNHWVLDIPAGAALAVTGLVAAAALAQRTRPEQDRGSPALRPS